MPDLIEPAGPACGYSVVVPMHNEEAHVEPLYAQLVAAMDGLGDSYELIFVDDGSADATFALLTQLAERDSRVRAMRLKKNVGQTAALAAGFDYAAGEILIAMDADLRSSPAEIPLLLDKLGEGYDLVVGWRRDRRHEGVLRTWPSTVANWLLAKLSGVPLHDFGSTFKVVHREVVRGLHLYGDQHRFIPVLASWLGARMAEVPVSDSPRRFGKSHYGLGRMLRVPFDLITIKFLRHYRTRPLQLFGPLALAGLGAGTALLVYELARSFFSDARFVAPHAAVVVLGVLLFLAGWQSLAMGLVAELLVRNHFTAGQEPIYQVERIVRAASLTRSAR